MAMMRWWSAPNEVRTNAPAMLESVVVYWYVTPKSDTWLSASNLCRYAAIPPKAVPSLGLEDTIGTRSHGDDRSFGVCSAACRFGVRAGGAGACATASATEISKSI